MESWIKRLEDNIAYQNKTLQSRYNEMIKHERNSDEYRKMRQLFSFASGEKAGYESVLRRMNEELKAN